MEKTKHNLYLYSKCMTTSELVSQIENNDIFQLPSGVK